MARVLAEGVGAERATVWLRVGGELRPEASWPTDASPRPRPLRGDELPTIDEGGHAAEVRDQGELLGALSLVMPASEPMNPAKEALVQDLASQAGLVLRNARLIEELRASRQRIVAAQDARAKQLERNIHDGAQQQLVALTVKLRLLGQLASRDPARTAEMASELQTEATEALEDLRDLARGIYPPLLADKGLPAALEAQARKAAFSVSVETDGVRRYPPDVESALYFCCLEALQNVAKYAHATHATVRLSDEEGLSFEVSDDGLGFDPSSTGYGTGLQGMADRLDAIGGTLQMRSAPGEGTVVTGRVPAEDR
jgi:signal transduction histidine kinase